MGRDWRVEADEEWLRTRRTTFFRRHRSRLGRAFADAQLGPYAGAPRYPTLKLQDKVYSHVRYALRGYSYTSVQVELIGCPRCGYQLLEEHSLVLHRADGAAVTLGRVRMCRRCHREAWLFTSHMPSILAARKRDSRVVL
jgi:hypothetical protein